MNLLTYAKDRLLTTVTGDKDRGPSTADPLMTLSATLNAAMVALPGSFRPPRLVVVGTQSSGKSGLLNALFGMQVLPTGTSMTTRASIQVELVTTTHDRIVEFGSYADTGHWSTTRRITLANPPTEEQQADVQAQVGIETSRLLERQGATAAVAALPVCVRVLSPTVPNMAFVDLPGITMHALVSQGQPVDVCAQIRDLIASHVDDRAIVLLVCAARADLEADAAVELCMTLTQGRRTIGCLTKADLCDAPQDALRYLTGRHPPDLTLEHGYFMVQCRRPEDEDAYFRTAFPAPTAPTAHHRMGSRHLSRFVHDLVASEIRECLPELRDELRRARDDARNEYALRLHDAVPQDESARLNLAHDMIARFAHRLECTVTARTPDASVGRELRSAFAALRASIRARDFFEAVGDAEIAEAVGNSEGWSMSSPIPPVELVEYFVRHKTHRPIQTLLSPCTECVRVVGQLLLGECKTLTDSEFRRFSRFQEWICAQYEQIQTQEMQKATSTVATLLEIEEAYVFTDDVEFVKDLSVYCTSPDYATNLRSILSAYMAVIANGLANQMPKLVVWRVRDMLSRLQHALTSRLPSDVTQLFYETEEIEELRARLTKTINSSENCLRAIAESLVV